MRTKLHQAFLAFLASLALFFASFAAGACAPTDRPITQPSLMPDASPFQYPVGLWDQRVQGEALLLVRVTRAGTVDSVTLENSSGHPALDSAALAGAHKLRFVPGKRGERPMDMWTKLPVRFSLDSTAAR